ncbi:MAG: tryptophan synthase subunit alpha [Lewinellaceae bacterium]|nr:tryptophan synthase subunit alpha [Lewinellaceae bacterium]
MQIPIMAHLVLGYPTLPESIRTAELYIAAGCAILELQIPFSHPTADGPVITRACQVAVEEQGITVANCLEAIAGLTSRFPQQEIIVMSYLNRIYTYGADRFREKMERMGIRHLIVPDLPVDSPVAKALHQPGQLQLLPVLAANVSDARLQQLLAAGHDFFYLMSDFKITGSTFSLNPRLKHIAQTIKATQANARVGIGFGISTAEQIHQVLEVADCAIIGSALIRAQEENRLNRYFNELLLETTKST